MDSGTSPGQRSGDARDADSFKSTAAAAASGPVLVTQRASGPIPNPTFLSATSASSFVHRSAGVPGQAPSAGFRLASSSASATGGPDVHRPPVTTQSGLYGSMSQSPGVSMPREGYPRVTASNGRSGASAAMVLPEKAPTATFPQRIVMGPSLVRHTPPQPSLAPPVKRPCVQAPGPAPGGHVRAAGMVPTPAAFWTIPASSAASMSSSSGMVPAAGSVGDHRLLGKLLDAKTPFGDRGRSPLDLPLPAVGAVPPGARAVQRRRGPMPPPAYADGPSHFVFRPPSPRVPQFAAPSPTYEHLPARTPAVFPQYGEVDPSCRYIGVRKSEGTYWACIERLGTSRWLGPFSSAAAAARAVDTALLLFHGRDAVTNFSYDLETFFADEKEANAEGAVAEAHAELYADAYRVKRDTTSQKGANAPDAETPQSTDAPEPEEQPDAKTRKEKADETKARRPRRAAAQRAQYTLQRADEEHGSGGDTDDDDRDDREDGGGEGGEGEAQSDIPDGQASEPVPLGSLRRA